ncbi:hypothetical protein Cch01nite_18540 [Cellulomonas chitinilytica]|uniref:Putative T7SS secretion signal domain-containing protein n=1 Tax=Cellulomonas chitinilytica TaxID=398759 RepID=A0A919P1W1_9CELL|nr:hypothetical protein [Cellulomonas chitinilytica]GIG21130.1 hypothetical protein Cch01nite_18540 [Cellulomonas chitinilytica]
MAAALGSTTDALELIPGRPAAVYADADNLRRRARQLEDAADDLARVRTPGWEGAQADRFCDALATRPKGWRKTADALDEAATALTRYADVLTAAQGDAAHAIELWTKGEHLTAAAKHGHSLAVDAYNRTLTRGFIATRPPAFVDTGAHARQEALDVLDHARSSVKRAGDDAADTLAGIEVSDTPVVRTHTETQGRTDSGQVSMAPIVSIDPKTGKVTFKAGKFEGETLAGSATASVTAVDGHQFATAQASAQAGFKSEGEVSAEDGQLRAKVSATGGLFGDASASIGNQYATVNANASAMVGGAAEAGVGIGKEGVDAEAGAFLGAKGHVGGGVQMGGLGANVGAEGWLGAGAEAKFKAGMNEDGSWSAKSSAGASFPVGGSLSSAFTVAAEDVGDFLHDAVGSLTVWTATR